MPLKRFLLRFLRYGPGRDGGPVRCRVFKCCN
nr:MAG TPA: hypothetical protein [Caudoviricetes sp.]